MSLFPRIVTRFLAPAILGLALPAWAATRTVSFRVPASCSCFECGFQAHKAISRIEGVRKTTLSVRDRRLDVEMDDTAPVSDVALAVAKQEMGKDSALVWSVPKTADVEQWTAALGRVPGVKAARPDAKDHAVLLTFSGQTPVRLAQLEAVAGTADARG